MHTERTIDAFPYAIHISKKKKKKSWNTNHLDTDECPNVLWNQNVHYHAHRSHSYPKSDESSPHHPILFL
jgi:hypothetical protein